MKSLGIAVLCGLSIAATAGLAQAQTDTSLKPADTNGDGKVSLAEYQASRRDFIMKADANHDNKITKAEWDAYAKAARSNYELDGVAGAERFGQGAWWQAIDANHDGVATAGEVDTMVSARFNIFDTDHSGLIEQAEAESVPRPS